MKNQWISKHHWQQSDTHQHNQQKCGLHVNNVLIIYFLFNTINTYLIIYNMYLYRFVYMNEQVFYFNILFI